MSSRGSATRTAAGGAVALGAAAAGLVWVGAGRHLARVLLTPVYEKVEDQTILEVTDDTVLLEATPDAVVPGQYGLSLPNDGHARIADIVERDQPPGTVRRRLVAVDEGELRPGPARWDQYWFFGPPEVSLGLPTDHIELDSELGPMPAWLVPGAASPDAPAARPGTWAVFVHGRGAQRAETLRGVQVAHRLGVTCLVPAYRNDVDAPAAVDGRYALGLSEWRDVEAAVQYAAAHGAIDIILFGWSMGGAIVLQLLDRSVLAPLISRVVLDSPVVSWSEVMRHHARLAKAPPALASMAASLMGERRARRLVGVHEPLDVASTDWPDRAGDLRHPILLIHSLDDEFVPSSASQRLAAARPDLIRFEPWRTARHVKEWNVDPQRWEALVTQWVTAAPGNLVSGSRATTR
nr:lysophospholipase [Kribbia dieselivorans]